MNINSFGFSTPRAMALGTVAVTIGLGVASGVFSTFYTTIQSGQTCTYGYGYDNDFGYGYGYGSANGYDCVAAPVVTPPSSGGGGGGGGGGGSSSSSSSSVGTPTTLTPTAITALAKNAVILAKDIGSTEFKSAIVTLIQAGVMNNATRVNPDNNITRGEFLKLLALANGYKEPVKVTKKFKDMPKKHTLLPYVNYGVAMGWVNVKNEKFRPNDIITQGEIDKLILAIKKQATADTIAKKSKGVTRGKAAKDIVDAFFTK